jgi:hypothetical protein
MAVNLCKQNSIVGFSFSVVFLVLYTHIIFFICSRCLRFLYNFRITDVVF